jgi:predicted nucleic acid-binding protein
VKVVVDSSIIIDYLRGGKKWSEFIDDAPRDIQLFLPTVVIFELFSGSSTSNTRTPQEVIAFIRGFRDIKIKIQAADYIIAATALSINATILTLNRKHFEQIPGLAIYGNS